LSFLILKCREEVGREAGLNFPFLYFFQKLIGGRPNYMDLSIRKTLPTKLRADMMN